MGGSDKVPVTVRHIMLPHSFSHSITSDTVNPGFQRPRFFLWALFGKRLLSIDKMPLKRAQEAEPRWPATLAVLAIGGLHYALPSYLTYGPDWLLLALVVLLLVPTIIARRAGRHGVNQRLGFVIMGLVTAGLAVSLGLLIWGLPSHREQPKELLVAASSLWVSNILVFASWYWRLDAGGPHEREVRGTHTGGAFLFPQMMLDPDLKEQMGDARWSPGFVDYLFLAFNTSTAFSPTDVPVLTRWAKLMMMVQSLISLSTVVLLAARAVNIL